MTLISPSKWAWAYGGAGFALILLITTVAEARKPRLRIDHIDASRCASIGRIDITATDVELEGIVRKRPKKDYRLLVDGESSGGPLTASETQKPEGTEDEKAATDASPAVPSIPLQLGIVVQITASYADNFNQIREGLVHLLNDVPRRSRISIVGYHSQIRRIINHGSVAAAKIAIQDLNPTDVGTDPALVPAVRSTLGALGAASEKAARQVLVVVSDGSNLDGDWNIFRAAGNRAKHNKIPIFPIAFSPIDERGPMLNLGEIAKRSSGTFRWAREGKDIATELKNLAGELNSRLVLPFSIPDRCESGHRLQLQIGKVKSNSISIDAQELYKAPKKAGGAMRIVLVVLGLLVLLTILALVTRWMIKSNPQRPTK